MGAQSSQGTSPIPLIYTDLCFVQVFSAFGQCLAITALQCLAIIAARVVCETKRDLKRQTV